MSGYAVFVHNGELIVAHGLDAAQQLAQRLTGAIASGDAVGIIVRTADGAALPVVEAYNEAAFWSEVAQSVQALNINALTRDTLAAMFGIIGGLLVLPAGPSTSVMTDIFLSEIYKAAYDAISLGSINLARSFMDYLDRSDPIYATNADGYLLDQRANTAFNDARDAVIRRDPLVLDLDGDGLELIGASGNILFDHNADGIKTGTGWAGADDGLLVWDRDGNGLIDSGRELFGNNTLLANGQRAADGYAALRELNANGDGVLNTLDAQYAHLRVWRDLDQDGFSDEGELFSLDQVGVTQIGLSKTAFTQTLADGMRLDGQGSFLT